MFNSTLTFFQNLGKALMLPIAVLPIAGLMLRLGQPDLLDIKFIAESGGVIFANLPLLFAIGVAVGFSADAAGAAALAGVVAYLTLTSAMKALGAARGLSLDMGVLAGILSGIIGGTMYNRFRNLKLPSYLAFFSGKRFVPIISALFALACAALLSFAWPPVQAAINAVGNYLVNAGAIGAALFGTLNRLLLAVGLHQILNTLCWFQFGSFTAPDGAVIHGDLYRFFAGDPSAGMFMTGFFPVMMFGLPAVALAFYLTTAKERRAEVAGLLISLVLTAFLTGITEPLEYTFMFLAPLLYLIHALLTGLAMGAAYLAGYHAGFTFSAGAIDLLLSWGKAVRPETILWLGPLFFGLYFVIFYYAIKAFDLKTPGRGDAVTPDDGGTLAGKERTPVNQYDMPAAGYIESCGGLENIVTIDNCITRLRLQIRDSAKIDEAAIRRLGASGVIRMGGRAIQIIVGSQVEPIAEAMKKFARAGKVPDFAAAPEKVKNHHHVQSGEILRVLAPVDGKVCTVESVPDATFAERMAGDGLAIEPEGHSFVSPVDGVITSLPESGHAFVVRHASGVEFLVHIGIETVALKGKGFRVLAAKGNTVTAGTPVIEVDWTYVRANAKSTLSPLLVTTPQLIEDLNIITPPGSHVNSGDYLINLRTVTAVKTGGTASLPVETVIKCRIGDPCGIHARPAARLGKLAPEFTGSLVVRYGGRSANFRSVGELMNLGVGQNAEVEIAASGTGAQQAAEAVAAALAAVPGEENGKSLDFSRLPTFAPSVDALKGVAASPGIGIAPFFIVARERVSLPETGNGPEFEKERLENALKTAAGQLSKLAYSRQATGIGANAEIFEAHAAIIGDSILREHAFRLIGEGKSAEFAWRSACSGQAEKLLLSGSELIAERSGDYRDIAERVVSILQPNAAPDVCYPKTPFILVASDLSPSKTAALPRDLVAGIVTSGGGPAAHTAILARALSIPAVVAAGNVILSLVPGRIGIVNGVSGFVEPSPDATILSAASQAAEELRERRGAFEADKFGSATSGDGCTIEVAANIASEAEAAEAAGAGADGIGLLRTEIMVQDATTPPDENDLTAAFAATAAAMHGKPVIIRTYDIGGDKPVAFMPQEHEENPFLGIRGLRLCFEYPEIFTSQLRAILLAIRDHSLNGRIMFPMVGQVGEFEKAARRVEELCAELSMTCPPLGMMIEVPAAVWRIDEFAAKADFFSIGTNDLTQYILAMDRQHPLLASQTDPLDPAVLRAIAAAIDGAHRCGKWIGVCGNMASDPVGALLLFGLGADELSVGIPALAEIKALIRGGNFAAAQTAAKKALACADASEVRAIFSRG